MAAPGAAAHEEPVLDLAAKRRQLVDDFRSLLDEPTILAIVGDYDDLDEARRVLLQIAENVPVEEASGFDPSGLQNGCPDSGAAGPAETVTTESLAGQQSLDSDKKTTDTSLSVQSSGVKPPLAGDVDDEDLEVQLQELFPGLKPIDIRSALKAASGDPEKAFDELQSIQYLEESGQRQKGIDGFFHAENAPDSRKKKGRKNAQHFLDTPSLFDKDGQAKRSGRGTPLSVAYTLSPVDAVGSGSDSDSRASQLAPVPPPRRPVYDWQTRSEEASYIRATSAQSFAAARQAFKRGRSDPAFRQVAGFYAEQGQEQVRRARQAESEASDAWVASQSDETTVDLHGVQVRDGVRIALERTRQWWEGLGEGKIARARKDPLVIVTGMGYHSTNGISKLRQDVGAALKREGWKVIVETGQFVVNGRQ